MIVGDEKDWVKGQRKSIACEEICNGCDAHLSYFKSVLLTEKIVMVII
jgi:hypothetical protein